MIFAKRLSCAVVAAFLALALPVSNTEAKGRKSTTYHTYTKAHPNGNVYTGRTSGAGKPGKILQKRDAGHHMNKQGYGPAALDKSSGNKEAIRGREQQLIDKNKADGVSGNKINGISPNNPKRDHYLSEAEKEFGKP